MPAGDGPADAASTGRTMTAGDALPYDQMLERALRGVVRDALNRAATSGLPGEHHFYVTFRTDHPGVDIHKSLRAQYPQEMTIVLQHQFWNLAAGEESFGVTLSFSGVPQRLVVPYEAVTAFADPSVNFALRFQGLDASTGEDSDSEGGGLGAPPAPAAEDADGAQGEAGEAGPAEVADLSDRFQRRGKAPAGDASDGDTDAGAAESDRDAPAGEADEADESGETGGSAEVVTLDAFRKKK